MVTFLRCAANTPGGATYVQSKTQFWRNTMGASDAAAQHLLTSAALREVSLEDKYTQRSGRIYLSGIQALVRLPLLQRWRDQAAGLHTAGFVSGYRGSPLGGLDEALW